LLGEEAHSAQHFLTDQAFHRQAKEVELALGDSAEEVGFGMHQQPKQEVGFELAWLDGLVGHLGTQCLHFAQLV